MSNPDENNHQDLITTHQYWRIKIYIKFIDSIIEAFIYKILIVLYDSIT